MGGRLCPLISPLGQPCLCLIKHASQPVHQFLSQPLRERPTEFLPAQMCLFQKPVRFWFNSSLSAFRHSYSAREMVTISRGACPVISSVFHG